MGEALRWLLCGGVGGLATLFMVGNWMLLIGTAWTKKPTSLVFPFLGGPVCAAACWFSPSASLQRWFWVPLVLDFTLLVLVGIVVAAIARWASRSSPASGGPGAAPDRPGR